MQLLCTNQFASYLFYHTILLFYCAMTKDIRKKRREALRNRKNTLFKKAYELGQMPDVEVAVIICHGKSE